MLGNNSSEFYYNKGIMQFEEGQYDLSIENFNKSIEIDSSNFNFYYNLGLAYIKKEEYDLAIENFKEGLALNPDEVDLYHNLGIAYFNKNKFNEAINAYKKAIKIKSTDSASFDNLGIVYFTLNNYDDAISNFKQAVKLNSQNPSFNYNLAYTYYVTEQYDLAKEFLLRTISLNENDDEAYFNLGNVYIKQKEFDQAKEIFEKVLFLNPDHIGARSALAKLNNEEEIKEEIDEEEVPVKQVETKITIVAEKLKDELDLDMEVEAEKNFKNGIDFLNKQEFELAIAELKNAVILKKDFLEAQNALEYASKALNDFNELVDKGLTSFARNKYAQSIDYFKKALALKPHDYKTNELLNRVEEKYKLIEKNKKVYKLYMESGKYDLAVATLKKTISENPLDPDAHFDLGNIYIKQKKYKLAIESLKKAASVDPDRKDIKDALFQLMKKVNYQY